MHICFDMEEHGVIVDIFAGHSMTLIPSLYDSTTTMVSFLVRFLLMDGGRWGIDRSFERMRTEFYTIHTISRGGYDG